MISDLKPLKAKFSELMVIDETLTLEDRITFVFAVEGPIDRMPRELSPLHAWLSYMTL
jgi:hypothetical protein